MCDRARSVDLPRLTPLINPRPGIFKLRRHAITQTIGKLPVVPPMPQTSTIVRCCARSDESEPSLPEKKSQTGQTFFKRFSVRPACKTHEPTEPKRRMSMLSSWRRRRSSTNLERERSPLVSRIDPSKSPVNVIDLTDRTVAPNNHRCKIVFRDFRRKSVMLSQSTKSCTASSADPGPDPDISQHTNHILSKVSTGKSTTSTHEDSSHMDRFVNDDHLSFVVPPTGIYGPVYDPDCRHSETLQFPSEEQRSSYSSTWDCMCNPNTQCMHRLSFASTITPSTSSADIEFVASSPTMRPFKSVGPDIIFFGRTGSGTNDGGDRLSVSKPTGQDSGWSSELSSLYQPTESTESNGQEEELNSEPSPKPAITRTNTTTEWTNRLRKSLNRAKQRCCLFVGKTLFNKDPVEGMHYLIEHGVLAPVPIAIARFLLYQDGLSRQAIGDYFGSLHDSMSSRVLREYLQLINMRDMHVDQAIRIILSHFHPAGESQKISHLMQVFQDVYIAQNDAQVTSLYLNKDTVEVLAYSVLMLHTDLHNPNLRRLGQRMSEAEFIHNNRGIDSGKDLPTDLLQGIYRRVAECEFKTLPDPVDRLRRLDSMLVGSLKTENFIQRHRRFVGWVAGQQLDRVLTRYTRHHKHWRYLLVFNDILITVKPLMGPRPRSPGSLLNMAAAAALGSDSSNRSSLANLTKTQYYSDQPMSVGLYQIRSVLPLKNMNVLVFETPHNRFGLRLCNLEGPMLNFALNSSQARQKLIDWIHTSIVELNELQLYYQQCAERKTNSTPVSKDDGSTRL
ncbi:IQ motif and SEC7 domain-containing protein [Paragonimus westermani]|uniref:IQ motif and SEC7 domain-containing protein n=1 Tax=Paragonimus westermani TaxID=34504 RepID=A0A5J4P1S9_9TREM|nr:IQ motif and SEC7 domain-containing protein [Paragonimus westermani]